MNNVRYRLSPRFFIQVLLVLFCISKSYPQVTEQWVRIYDGPASGIDEAKGIAVDNLGNVYVTGSSIGIGSISDYATIKYNSAGVQQWVARYNGPSNNGDDAHAIVIDDLGNVYVTGGSTGSGNSDYATIKYNSAGIQQWVARYNGIDSSSADYARDIEVDDSGNVYVTGNSSGVGGSNLDCATIKYNSAGVQQWVARYNGPGNSSDGVAAIAVDVSGNVYITGESWGSGSSYDYVTIKYNSAGNQQWAARYNGPGNLADLANSIAIDGSGNVYVTGRSRSETNADYATIKYNSAGVQQWVQRYNGPANENDHATSLVIDNSSNVYVTGGSNAGTGFGSDYATIKYNSDGVEQWIQRYNGPENFIDEAYSIAVDGFGNVYVTGTSQGSSSNLDYATIKYDSTGNTEWVQRYNGPDNLVDWATSIVVDNSKNVYVTGWSSDNESGNDFATIKYSQGLTITSPSAGEKWIAGETDTIRWTGGDAGHLLDIEYSTDNGNSYSIIQLGGLADSGSYVWKIPKDIISTKVKIKLTDVVDTLLSITSSTFKIKPYLLTRMSSTGDYDAYSKFRDPYAFGNDSASVWPIEFWQNFDYTGTDPFTGFNYLVGVHVWLLLQTSSSDHPDWVSWVRTFGVSACYYNTSFPPVYSITAFVKWIDFSTKWGGSCFGMSTSNILLFKNTTQFQNNYPSFPTSDPLSIIPDDSVRTVINELYTHQMGLEHSTYRASTGLLKTPNQTLREIRTMLLDDDPLVRTLSIVSNDAANPGGHSIMAYKVEQDTTLSNIFYVFTYDNAYPNNLDSAIIIVDTLANSGNGTWSPIYAWTNWGGTKWFYLREPAINYFTIPTLPKNQPAASPFILGENELQILNTRKASIRITDQQGNSTGFINGVLLNNIPGSIPNIIENGSSGPPIGYDLLTANYSVQFSECENTHAFISFYTENKTFKIFRNDAEFSDNDRYFFDGGVSITNPDQHIKNVNLLNIINETTHEKAFFINEVELANSDSVKIINPDDNSLDLISYGSAKEYQIELNYASQSGLGRFQNNTVQLTQNTTHKLAPNWQDLTNSQLTIYVDEGNDGTIDDTLYIANTVDVEDEGNLLTPNEYNLAQNYPNPFNPITKIKYAIPQNNLVTLKVYDLLGREVATLVNEEKPTGSYEVEFDASMFSSGIYFYRLQAGSFVETKKMILIK